MDQIIAWDNEDCGTKPGDTEPHVCIKLVLRRGLREGGRLTRSKKSKTPFS